MMDKGKTTTKENYSQVYWTDKVLDLSNEVYNLLVDIDCNYSRLLRSLLQSIKNICLYILSLGKNYRHYEWELLIREKETGIYYSSLPSGNYDIEEMQPGKRVEKEIVEEEKEEEEETIESDEMPTHRGTIRKGKTK